MTTTESLTSPVPSPQHAHATEHIPTSPATSTGVTGTPGSAQFPVVTTAHTPPDTTHSTEDEQSGDEVNVWTPGLRLGIGVVVILLGLWWSLHLTPTIDQVGYIPTMFAYLIVMIIGGALMITGATTLWTRISTPTDAEQAK